MPRKVKVINLNEDNNNQEIQPEESKVDKIEVVFDEFSQIKNKVDNEENNNIIEDNNCNNNIDNNIDDNITDKPKKPARKSRAKPKETIIIEDVKPIEEIKIVEEVKPIEEEKPQKKIRTQELVQCPKCNKSLTQKSLRYFHEKSCPGVKIERENIPVKRRVKEDNDENKNKNIENKNIINIPEHIIENEVKKRIQNTYKDRMVEKMKLKEERIKKLSAQIA